MKVPNALVAQVVERTKQLVTIPAPSLQEHDRASLVTQWWSAELSHVSTDDVGNVWAQVCSGHGPALLVAAHLDTVFGNEVAHVCEERDGRLYGPSVGDNSVAVASLAALGQLLPANASRPVWVVGTVGEEGLGNLAGIRHAIAHPLVEIGAIIAIEGNWLGRVCLTGVGSTRYRVTLGGPGGHAWEASDVDSAVHGVARVVAAIDAAPSPAEGRSAVNVGKIGGGSAINARADQAWFDVDLRAEAQTALDQLADMVHTSVVQHAGDLSVEWQSLGDRPAGRLASEHPLATAAVSCLAKAGLDVEITAASTDANAAHAAGIPALALGITHGRDEHTTGEWIELSPIGTGLEVLASTITTYLRSTQ